MGATNTYNPGRTYYLLISDDNWTTTYTLECITKHGLKRSRSVNKQDTQCGIAKARGSVDRMMDVEAVTNLTPDAVASGVGTASYKKVATWFEADTALKVKRKVGDGSTDYLESGARIVSLDDSNDVASNQTYSLTLELEGTLDETA